MIKRCFNVYLLALVILIARANCLYAKSSIKEITSAESAEKVENKIPEVPRIPGEINTHSIGIGLGQTRLMGDFRDLADDAITPDILYNYSASHSFDLLVDFHYSEHKFKNQKVIIPGLAIGIKAKTYQIDSFAPFLLGGFGFYQPSVKRELNGELVNSRKKITFGYHLGLGGELRLNRHYVVGVLLHYHNPFDVKQEVGSDVEGAYFKMLLTAMYTF